MNEITPLKLFRQGYDTIEIAAYLGCTEATAANLIHREKEAERATADTSRSLIRYAGYGQERA